MVAVTAAGLVVRFGDVPALAGVDLRVEPGELFLLLGPSGCGKTTLLRSIAGFVHPDAGTIHFDREDVTGVPPHGRNTGMVFQSFALWPHLTVGENVAFGLKERRVERGEIAERVGHALRSVRMEDHARRRIHELSGGEQQRVALARALVVRPKCLLLDEPLSNLDARLRHAMREEIRRVCKEFGLTTIYVTHDQKEALAVADRIAVMREGRILQIGTPLSIYRAPASREVASFLGDTNLVKGSVVLLSDGETRVESPLGTFSAETPAGGFRPEAGEAVWISVRPECWRLERAAAASNSFAGRIARTTHLGEIAEHEFVETGGTSLKVFELNPKPRKDAAEAYATVAPEDVVLLPRPESA
jgi:ABC-type Fe3+/spermidine/putrescine transport system ATPase subunit